EVERPDECWSVDTQLLRLLERKSHLRAALVQEKWKERRDLYGIRRPHRPIVPKDLPRRALLLALRVLNAVRGLGYKVESCLGYFFSADDASTVLAALETPQRLVDQVKASLEHGLAREVELPRFGLARHVRGVLVGDGDITTAIALRDGEALLDTVDRRREVGTFALESLAQRSRRQGPAPERVRGREPRRRSDRVVACRSATGREEWRARARDLKEVCGAARLALHRR